MEILDHYYTKSTEAGPFSGGRVRGKG